MIYPGLVLPELELSQSPSQAAHLAGILSVRVRQRDCDLSLAVLTHASSTRVMAAGIRYFMLDMLTCRSRGSKQHDRDSA